jgi:hypothetical protein
MAGNVKFSLFFPHFDLIEARLSELSSSKEMLANTLELSHASPI